MFEMPKATIISFNTVSKELQSSAQTNKGNESSCMTGINVPSRSSCTSWN